MIGALFYGNDVNMNKVWTMYDVCMLNYVNMKVGTVIGVFGVTTGVWGHDWCGKKIWAICTKYEPCWCVHVKLCQHEGWDCDWGVWGHDWCEKKNLDRTQIGTHRLVAPPGDTLGQWDVLSWLCDLCSLECISWQFCLKLTNFVRRCDQI